MQQRLTILSLDHKDVSGSLSVQRDVLYRRCDSFDSPGYWVDKVEGRVRSGDGVVKSLGHAGAGGRLLGLHILKDIDDAVGLLFDLLEHQLADLRQLLDDAELTSQLGGVDHLRDGQGLDT